MTSLRILRTGAAVALGLSVTTARGEAFARGKRAYIVMSESLGKVDRFFASPRAKWERRILKKMGYTDIRLVRGDKEAIKRIIVERDAEAISYFGHSGPTGASIEFIDAGRWHTALYLEFLQRFTARGMGEKEAAERAKAAAKNFGLKVLRNHSCYSLKNHEEFAKLFVAPGGRYFGVPEFYATCPTPKLFFRNVRMVLQEYQVPRDENSGDRRAGVEEKADRATEPEKAGCPPRGEGGIAWKLKPGFPRLNPEKKTNWDDGDRAATLEQTGVSLVHRGTRDGRPYEYRFRFAWNLPTDGVSSKRPFVIALSAQATGDMSIFGSANAGASLHARGFKVRKESSDPSGDPSVGKMGDGRLVTSAITKYHFDVTGDSPSLEIVIYLVGIGSVVRLEYERCDGS